MKPASWIILPVIGLGACMPMEQAPLVYSSKDQFGVGLSAGTPDAPGLDVTIGYKGLDAAYVPVVVAKSCLGRPPAACAGDMYRLTTINAHNKRSNQATIDEKRIEDLKRAIEAANREIDENSRRIAAIRGSAAKLAQAGTELSALGATDAAGQAPALTAEQVARRAALEAEIAALTPLATPAAAQEATTLDAVNTARAAAVVRDTARLDALLARRNEASGDDKTDALSVYGSFDGNAMGEAKGASLSLGKTFSTGIAAQNMTQGLAASARELALARCIETATAAVDRMADGAPKDALRDRLLTFCKPQ